MPPYTITMMIIRGIMGRRFLVALKFMSKATYSYFIPTIIALLRVFSSTGQALYTVPKFIYYLTGSTKHETEVPLSMIVMTSNSLVQLGTRVPVIYRQFNLSRRDPPPYDLSIDDLNHKGKSIYAFFMTFGLLSGFFTSFNSYLGTFKICSFIVENIFDSTMDKDELEQAVNYIALLAVAANLFSYFFYTLV